MPIQISSTSVIDLDAQQSVIFSPVKQTFSLQAQDSPVPQNTLVTPWAGRQMIRDLFEKIWDNPASQDEPIAIEFDRQSLGILLSQNGCEGLRFHFCKHSNRKTLVAFGINKDGNLIGEEMFKKDFDKSGANFAPVPGSEEGHGTTLAEFRKIIGEPPVPALEKTDALSRNADKKKKAKKSDKTKADYESFTDHILFGSLK